MMISVVIPTFNEQSNIGRCLHALAAQTLSKREFEIIVVDNGSADRTVAEAEAFLDILPLRITSTREPTISGVRNFGVQLAGGDLLAFLDADCFASPNWLEQAIALRPEHALWGADYRVPEDATWVGRVWLQFQAKEKKGEVAFLPGGCLFSTRAAFLALGGFDASIETSEDVELCARARSRGMRVVAFPSLAVFHEGTPRTLQRFYRQNRWHGRHVLRVFLNNLPSTRNIGVVGVSAYTLLTAWGAAIGLLLALWRGNILYFLVPLVLFVLPALLLSLRKTVGAGRIEAMPALWALYQTYFLARAASLTHVVSRGRR